jgi:heterogeneous nuclear ribonucleoprotein L
MDDRRMDDRRMDDRGPPMRMDDRGRLDDNVDRRIVARGGLPPPGGPNGGVGCVLMVYNLPRDKVGAEQLLNLFCLYGNVIRIKLLSSPANAAAVQLDTPAAVNAAIGALQRQPAFGVVLSVDTSRMPSIDPARPGDGMAAVVREFADSSLNRFRGPMPGKAPYKPNPTLYFANAPAGSDEESIKETIVKGGGHVPAGVEFLPTPLAGSANYFGGRRSGFLRYDGMSEALETLILANNLRLDPSSPHMLKLSFSAKGDAPRPVVVKASAAATAAAGEGGRRDRSRSRDRNAHKESKAAPAAEEAAVSASLSVKEAASTSATSAEETCAVEPEGASTEK